MERVKKIVETFVKGSCISVEVSFSSLFCNFLRSFKSNKNFTEKYKSMSNRLLFDCFSCGPCWLWYVWRRDDKTAHQITKTCISYEQCYSCCSMVFYLMFFFDVWRMMNDPLNSCKRPIKFIFYPLLFERPCELDDFLFVSCSVLVWLLFSFVVMIFIALSPITLSLLIGRIVIHFL